MAEAGDDALALLIARLRWPVPSVRLWVMQELAQLILDGAARERTEQALMGQLEQRRFEIDAVEMLVVFWLARSKLPSYRPPATLSDHVHARSPLSDVFSRDLATDGAPFGEYSTDVVIAPTDFRPTVDFAAAEGSHFPAVLRRELRWLEQRLWKPFQLQFAFEWESSKQRVAHVGHWVDHFLEGAHGDSTGQFFTQQSARARSGYLRTLTVAQQRWGLAAKDAEFFALSTLPLDPSIAWLTNSPPDFEIGPLVGASREVGLRQFVTDILSRSSKEGTLGAISFAHFISDFEVVDVSIALWHGSRSPEALSAHALDLVDDEPGLLGGLGLSLESSFKSPRPGRLPSGFRPLTCQVQSRRHGYLGADIASRGLLAPRLLTDDAVVCAREENGLLHFRAGEVALGHCGYWNTHWQPSHPLNLGSRVGMYLWLTESGLSELHGDAPGKLFYAWRGRWLTRENSYSKYDVEELVGFVEKACCG